MGMHIKKHRGCYKKEKYLIEISKEQCVLMRSIIYKENLNNSTYEPLKELINKLDKVIGNGNPNIKFTK